MHFAGEFETHITVRLPGANRIAALRRWAIDRGLKCLHIVLDRGESASQPMLTRRSRGELLTELKAASDIAERLKNTDFTATRIKIEVSPDNADVPPSAAEAASHPAGRYFEHHIKLLLDMGCDTRGIVRIAQPHSAHLSRNALRIRNDGREERFVTQRCHGVGRAEARQQLSALVDALTRKSHEIVSVEEEFVVYDDNIALDAGWIKKLVDNESRRMVSKAV